MCVAKIVHGSIVYGGLTLLSVLQGQLPRIDHATIMQCVALKMLTDFNLMYNACVGVLLKRDGDPSRSSTATPGKPSQEARGPSGHFFRQASSLS